MHGEDNSFVIPDHVQIYLLGDELPEETLHMEGSFLAEPGDHTDHYPHPCSRISQDFNGASLPLSIYVILRFFVIF